MNNSRWKMNKIGLLDFWYYDDQEFYFLDGRMLLEAPMVLENQLPCRALFRFF
ncbi:MAG: hypothetical protein ACLUU0_07205 [Anaerostipes hadrus]